LEVDQATQLGRVLVMLAALAVAQWVHTALHRLVGLVHLAKDMQAVMQQQAPQVVARTTPVAVAAVLALLVGLAFLIHVTVQTTQATAVLAHLPTLPAQQ
jgi:uncharacterized membrane protein